MVDALEAVDDGLEAEPVPEDPPVPPEELLEVLPVAPPVVLHLSREPR